MTIFPIIFNKFWIKDNLHFIGLILNFLNQPLNVKINKFSCYIQDENTLTQNFYDYYYNWRFQFSIKYN